MLHSNTNKTDWLLLWLGRTKSNFHAEKAQRVLETFSLPYSLLSQTNFYPDKNLDLNNQHNLFPSA